MENMGSEMENITVNSEILCTVEHITVDLMVVKFTDSNNKSYQGVLLDSTKRWATPIVSYCFYSFEMSGTFLSVSILQWDSSRSWRRTIPEISTLCVPVVTLTT